MKYPARAHKATLLPVTFPADEIQPCQGDARFTSEKWADHLAVKNICLTLCPVASFAACRALAEAEGNNKYGTYAGQPHNMHTSSQRPNCGTETGWQSHRAHLENPCNDCQNAHFEYVEAERVNARLRVEHGDRSPYLAMCVKEAAALTGISAKDIYSPKRNLPIVAARRIAAYAACELDGNQSSVGRALGRDHRTVSMLVKRIRDHEREIAERIVEAIRNGSEVADVA